MARPARAEVELFWQGPDGRWGCWDAFGLKCDALTFPNEAAALEALVLTFGPEWRHHRSLEGARVVSLDGCTLQREGGDRSATKGVLRSVWSRAGRAEPHDMVLQPSEGVSPCE